MQKTAILHSYPSVTTDFYTSPHGPPVFVHRQPDSVCIYHKKGFVDRKLPLSAFMAQKRVKFDYSKFMETSYYRNGELMATSNHFCFLYDAMHIQIQDESKNPPDELFLLQDKVISYELRSWEWGTVMNYTSRFKEISLEGWGVKNAMFDYEFVDVKVELYKYVHQETNNERKTINAY